jgi:hypothetical protein
LSTLEFHPQPVHPLVSRYAAYTILSAIMGRHLLEYCPSHWLSSRRFFVILPEDNADNTTFYAEEVQACPAPILRPIDSIRVIWSIDSVVK